MKLWTDSPWQATAQSALVSVCLMVCVSKSAFKCALLQEETTHLLLCSDLHKVLFDVEHVSGTEAAESAWHQQ